jgi:lysophospholipase L1-like esterase
MSLSVWLAAAAQLVFIGCAIAMAIWSQVSSASIAGLGFLGVFAAIGTFTKKNLSAALWLCSAVIWMVTAKSFIWDTYYALETAVVASALWVGATKGSKAVAFAWSFLAGVICLGAAYSQNSTGRFYLGLAAVVLLLFLLKLLFNLPTTAIQLTNTLLLVLVGLPVVDFFSRSHDHMDFTPQTWSKFYSYRESGGDPSAFARWWDYYLAQADTTLQAIFEPIPGGHPSYQLRTNSHVQFFDSLMSINSLGFRGPEIARPKDNTYRIVAIGESTTYGMTVRPDDKPWPRLLEQMIRDRLKPNRPVEVINAGTPGYTLEDNLWQFPRKVLPLRPDIIISYHGYNGFKFINAAIPEAKGPPPPRYRPRPLRLLADAEHRIKMIRFRRVYASKETAGGFPSVITPLDTPYAALYRQLINCCATNGIRLALANYCMAVNSNSDPKVIEFYRAGFTGVYRLIPANELHSKLVAKLAAEHPDICLIDTHPHLDGEYDKFKDLIHFTQEGRCQMAENVFAGIRGVLEKDLKTNIK